jgi:hypothetical protein
MVISLDPEDRSLNGNEFRRVVENLVETLGFSGHQYIAARHNDKDHEHVHVAINKIHPETFRIHSPAWDHQKLFTAGRVLELELGLTPLQSRVRDREKVPQRAADHEAHHGIDSFARWARKQLGPALRAGPSSGSSRFNGRRFRRLRILAHGVISSPVAPHTATLVRFDFCGDETGSAAVRMKKGSCEMRGDGVETQMGDPNAV